MNNLACQYAVIRFLPYVETGEFANVGVLLACPQTGFLNARLLPAHKTARISGFFDQLDTAVYRNVLRCARQELVRAAALVTGQGATASAQARQIFGELVRPREALLRFSNPHAILAIDPAETLQHLFATLVERDFITRDYRDRLLVRSVGETLRKGGLRHYFRDGRVGTEDLYLNVPFVHERDGRPVLAIKPLDLAKAEANQVYDAGGRTVDRIRRLDKRGLLTGAMLLALGMPEVTAAAPWRAAKEIMDDLNSNGATQAVAATDGEAITRFAESAAAN